MARYIDADALIKYIESKRLVFKDTATVATALKSQGDVIRMCIETCPTADVAPKTEVAREILEEIEAIFCGDGFHYFIRIPRYEELKKKYTGEQT